MQLIDVNSFIPQIERAPHKIYILELTLEELQHFKIASKHMLKHLVIHNSTAFPFRVAF